MERQGHLHGHGGYCRAWATQSPQEKQGKPGGDNSIVEELLNFSDVMEDDAGMAAHGEGVLEASRGNCSANSCIVSAVDSRTKSFSGGSDSRFSEEHIFRSLADAGLSDNLCEPYEELAELEWLSNFVEDSFSNEELHKQQLISGIKTTVPQPTYQLNYPFVAVAADDYESPPFTPEAPLPGKARSKRVRTVPDSWSTRLLLVDPTTESSSSDYSDTTLAQLNPVKQPTKKELAPAVDGRRCLHCATDKTPQWRAGPLGPKTLCNACGVRYKSGRLVPEYRPAASPTFVISKHSNSHRKVLELRRQKEIHQQQFLPAYDSAASSTAVVVVADEFLIHHHQHHPDYRPIF